MSHSQLLQDLLSCTPAEPLPPQIGKTALDLWYRFCTLFQGACTNSHKTYSATVSSQFILSKQRSNDDDIFL